MAALAAVASMLVACGGGSNFASLPGTGGTGIYASGPIAGFGSVIVNGIRFDDMAADVQIDGDLQLPGELRLGMVAGIVGTKSTNTVTVTTSVSAVGTARKVEVWSIAQGRITSFVLPDTFKVAGMTLITDVGTVFEGAMSVGDLNTSTLVKVWGQPLSADFRQWSVTRVEVLGSATDTITTGKVSLRSAAATLNGLALQPNGLVVSDGQVVRAVGTLADGSPTSTLTVSKITALSSTGNTTTATGYTKLQGVVTSVLSTSSTSQSRIDRLTMGLVEVDMNKATVSHVGAAIAQGTRIEVHGNWNAGVLTASKVEVKSAEQMQRVEIEGSIDTFVSVSNFTVRGQRCDASALTQVGGGKLSDLRAGRRVHLHGKKDGDIVRITELELK
jgi:Domain of unknown function (DUF5666)